MNVMIIHYLPVVSVGKMAFELAMFEVSYRVARGLISATTRLAYKMLNDGAIATEGDIRLTHHKANTIVWKH